MMDFYKFAGNPSKGTLGQGRVVFRIHLLLVLWQGLHRLFGVSPRLRASLASSTCWHATVAVLAAMPRQKTPLYHLYPKALRPSEFESESAITKASETERAS